MSSIPQPATFASSAHPPIPPGEGISTTAEDGGEGIGEGMTASGQPVARQGEPISERLASISDRLAVVAVAAHIMQRRAPRDCYARSIAHETHALALAVRELHRAASSGAPMRAPRIVDASPSPDTSPDTSPDATSASPSSHPASSPTAHKRRQTPPDARSAAQASECATHPHARRQGSLATADGATAEGGAQ